MARELISVVKEIFPDDEALHAHVENVTNAGDIIPWGKLVGRRIRHYPVVVQTRFFELAIHDRILYKIPEDSLPGPNISAAATMLAEINKIPTITGQLSQDELQELVDQSTATFNNKVKRPKVVCLTDFHAIEEANYDWANRKPDVVPIDRTTGAANSHPLSKARRDLYRAEKEKGLTDASRSVYDSSSVWIIPLVEEDLGGLSDSPLEKETNLKRHRLNWSRGTLFEPRLTLAVHWAFLEDVMLERGYTGNPFAVYVQMLRPSQWPIGWDYKTGKFLVANPQI